ncbi:MAG TPA: ABC transporter permease [bacterium]|nr:ABC transporter permease [bacterium]
MNNSARKVWLWRVAILVALVVLWQWGTQVAWLSRNIKLLDPFFISTPGRILQRLVQLSQANQPHPLLERVATTVLNTLLGFAVGVSTGFVTGLYLGREPTAAAVLEPYIVAFNTLPRIALVPLVTLMFGFGVTSKVVSAWLIVFFIVFFNTFEGVKNVDPDLVNAVRMLGARPGQITRSVYIPSALAWTFASLSPAISFALIGVVIAEFLGGDTGIGYLIISSLATLEAADMMVALLVLSVVGIVLALLVRRVERYLLRWQPRYYAQSDAP